MTPQSEKKLFLLDAMALIYRAYFAFSKNPRYNSKGLNTSAILGFTNTLMEVLQKEKPTHIAVCFDTSAPTSRHIEFPAYKAQREAMPEDLSISIPYIKDVIKAFNIPIAILDGHEADDIIGTLAKQAEKEGFVTYMMTPDKDFAQLVSENIFMYKPARMGNDVEILGIPEVLKKYEITNVDQVRDLLGLWGDTSDNIPGIPGVGEKTAKILISQFGSIENAIANAHEIQGKLREKVETHAGQAILSKKLATIFTEVPVNITIEDLKCVGVNKDHIRELFTELEFRTLAKRLIGENLDEGKEEVSKKMAAAASAGQHDMFATEANVSVAAPSLFDEIETAKVFKTIKDVEHNYIVIDTEEKRLELVALLSKQKAICFDTETTSIDANQAQIVGLSFAFKAGEAYYIPFSEDQFEAKIHLDDFKPIFENINIEKIGQNIKYDIIVLHHYGINVKGNIFDTMLAHYLIEPDMRHNMNIMAENYLGYSPVSIETLIGQKKAGQLSMRTVPLEQIKEYAAEDADITYQLKEVLAPQLTDANLTKLYKEVELPLVQVLADMEMTGVSIDTKALQEFSIELAKQITELENEIYECCGTRFNIASPKQLGDVLFGVLKIDPKAKMTKTKQYATGEEVLSKLIHAHPAVEKVLSYRELVKLKNTYVDTLPLMINPLTNKVHTSYNQAVAATGRLSSNNPNLQNIPIRTDRGREVRKAFIASDKNNVLMSADYSQIELRIIAQLSKDPAMIEAFVNKEDIHTATAAKVYGITNAEVTSDMRRNAKMVNFGIIYGISAFGLSQRLNIPRKEAAHIIEQCFIQYPMVKSYMDTIINQAREQGYVETILGRRRYLRDINSANAVVRGYAERNAINAPIQGSAADMIKVAMINIHKAMKKANLKSKMILQVHDELVFDVSKDEVDTLKPMIKHEMENAIKMTVPMEVEVGIGFNWLEAH
jgi:DNA polymerase-1